MRWLLLLPLPLAVTLGCTTSTADRGVDPRPEPAPSQRAPEPEPDKDAPMSDPKDAAPPVKKAPPPLRKAPAADTARYVEWMAEQKKPVTDTPAEDVSLRIGDWGFFSHGAGPGQSLDRAGLDRAKHVILRTDKGDWYTFLTTPGLDAAGAMKRVAWIYSAAEIRPGANVSDKDKLTAPALTTAAGTVTLQGWVAFPPNMSTPMRMTMTATSGGTKIVFESAKKL